jgi:hypothetical protein
VASGYRKIRVSSCLCCHSIIKRYRRRKAVDKRRHYPVYLYKLSTQKSPLQSCTFRDLTKSKRKRERCKEIGKNLNYDKEKYREMILDAAETVLGYFGFNRAVYENPGNNRKKKRKWYEELHEERTKDIQIETMSEKQ